MKIEIDVFDDQADYLVKQWLLAHYKMTVESTSSNPADQQYNAELCNAMELIFDYMGVEDALQTCGC
jgi:hypothetical protein